MLVFIQKALHGFIFIKGCIKFLYYSSDKIDLFLFSFSFAYNYF